MTDISSAPRRRDRSRPQRSTGATTSALPRLVNRWAPIEILSAAQVERIIDAAYRVLADGGLEIRSARARDAYRKLGAIVDDATQMVRIGRDIVEAQLAYAPETFVLHSRNPDR